MVPAEHRGPQVRRRMLAPEQELAGILTGRRPGVQPSEELLLRARLDLDAGRHVEAALQAARRRRGPRRRSSRARATGGRATPHGDRDRLSEAALSDGLTARADRRAERNARGGARAHVRRRRYAESRRLTRSPRPPGARRCAGVCEDQPAKRRSQPAPPAQREQRRDRAATARSTARREPHHACACPTGCSIHAHTRDASADPTSAMPGQPRRGLRVHDHVRARGAADAERAAHAHHAPTRRPAVRRAARGSPPR